jgi:hypothetical protein
LINSWDIYIFDKTTKNFNNFKNQVIKEQQTYYYPITNDYLFYNRVTPENFIKFVKENLTNIWNKHVIEVDIEKNEIISSYIKIFNPNFDNQQYNDYLLSKSYNNISEPVNLSYNTELWNKLIAIKNNTNNITTLSNDYIKAIINYDNTIIDILKKNILLYSNDIILWAKNMYLNGNIIIKFLEKLSEKYLKLMINNNINETILQKNEIINWSKILNINYNKYLTNYTIDEKIIRSFIYGKSLQFIYKLSDKSIITMINNYSIYNISIEESLIDLTDDYIFYLNYNNSDYNVNDTIESLNNNLFDTNLIEFNYKKINISFLSSINIKWLISALPLFINPLFILNNISNTTTYNINKFKNDIINNWNNNYNIYNTSELPLLQYFYKIINTKMNL